jgi:protocatechuate 3,4-dioxygenase beta subunit
MPETYPGATRGARARLYDRDMFAPTLRAVVVLVPLVVPGLVGACREPLRAPPEVAVAPAPETRHPSRITLVGPDEEGEPLEVAGQVLRPDGVTPAPGVTVYVYQTDRTGIYAPPGATAPRLRGWMTTDSDGCYAFRTIRPGSYPGETISAHVHVQLWGDGVPWQWNEDVLFADDPLNGARARERSAALGRFGPIRTPVRGADGVLRCTHDVRLKAAGDASEGDILHGVRDEPGAAR